VLRTPLYRGSGHEMADGVGIILDSDSSGMLHRGRGFRQRLEQRLNRRDEVKCRTARIT
jgi:hypothetical protein